MNSEMNSSRRWGDIMVRLDEDRSQRILRMTDAEWRNCAKQAIIANRGRGDLRVVLDWMDEMEVKRTEFKFKKAVEPVARDISQAAVTFRAWRDMVLEPAKYGDADWEDWLRWNEELTCGPGRWRVAAFWLELDEEEKARLRQFYAIRIQAAWRGHRTRDVTPGLNCEGCLAHKPSPLQFCGMHLCKGCVQDQHDYTFASKFLTPVVPKVKKAPKPLAEPNEHGDVPCQGCGSVCVYEGDYGEYRPGWWCSRACAYDL